MGTRWLLVAVLAIPSLAGAQDRAANGARGRAPTPPEITEEGTFYTVVSGDTLSEIAERLQISVDDLVLLNDGLNPDRLSVGQRLRVGSGRRRVEHRVVPGDTLARLAMRYRVTIPELRRWNPRMRGDAIREGRDLIVFTPLPASLSRSVGNANTGHLEHARQLPLHHPALFVRAPAHAYGTDETVSWLVDAIATVHREMPGTPRLEVHDLSREEGGPLMGHHSHTSGRDADVAYYRPNCNEPCTFRTIGPSDIDAPRQWALFRQWLEADRVEAIFVDYRLQRALYEQAVSEGVDRHLLNRWFQYPREEGNRYGIIRHHPRHANHFHVRFRCHDSDEECR
ncbi:MAG: penicillin-insensitive murein endopeptidase [Sandaracinaceae bacterium]|nr:penicillin-insensitive murein endopeptidase [Sandaracinaceae bacterium]